MPTPAADMTVLVVNDPEAADYKVQVVGDQVVDLSAAVEGDVLLVGPDGQLAPDGALTAEIAARTLTDADVAAVAAAVTPVRVLKTDGNITASVAASWTDLDPGGTATARPLDVVIPNVEAGQWLEFTPTFSVGSIVGGFLGNLATVVGGVASRIFDATFGFLPWSAPTGAAKDITVGVRFPVTSGMIENGSVRMRFQYQQATNARTINAVSGIPFKLEGRGPFG